MINPNASKIPGMQYSSRPTGTTTVVSNPDNVLNSRLQPANSIPAVKQDQSLDMSNDLKYEKSTYAPPALISNAGSFSLNTPQGGTQVISYDPRTGKAIINGAITLTQSLTVQNLLLIGTGGAIQGIAKEWYMELIDASYFTGNTSYEPVGPGPVKTQCVKTTIANTDFPTNVYDIYFESTLSADGTQTIDVQLYNETTGAAITNTQLTSGTAAEGFIARSGTIALTSGVNQYFVQMRKTPTAGTGVFPRIYSARLVFRLKGQ